MSEVEVVYECWSEFHKDDRKIIEKWNELEKYLQEQCSESVREKIETFLLDYGTAREHQGFLAGYKRAFRLWVEAMRE